MSLADPVRPTWRARHRTARHARRVAPVATPRRGQTPPTALPQRRRAALGPWLLGSLAAHLGLWWLLQHQPPRPPPPPAPPVPITLVEAPPPPPPPPVAPLPPPPPPLAPVKLARRVTPPPVATPPPPEPLDLPPPVEEPPAPATRRVRVVGLSLSSTVSTGGPAFAVGNSRLGQTAEEAAAPGDGAPLAPDVRAPRRTSAPEPEYPPELRAQGLEGDVGLEVRLDAQGAIADVRVVTPSAFAAFARAAVESARRGVYEPATTNGTAQPYTLRFTVRFRLRKSEGLR